MNVKHPSKAKLEAFSNLGKALHDVCWQQVHDASNEVDSNMVPTALMRLAAGIGIQLSMTEEQFLDLAKFMFEEERKIAAQLAAARRLAGLE